LPPTTSISPADLFLSLPCSSSTSVVTVLLRVTLRPGTVLLLLLLLLLLPEPDDMNAGG